MCKLSSLDTKKIKSHIWPYIIEQSSKAPSNNNGNVQSNTSDLKKKWAYNSARYHPQKIEDKNLHLACIALFPFCSLHPLIMFVMTVSMSTWVAIISSLAGSHLAATSLSRVFKQKLNLSATGTLSTGEVFTSSSHTALGKPFSRPSKYGRILSRCCNPDSKK